MSRNPISLTEPPRVEAQASLWLLHCLSCPRSPGAATLSSSARSVLLWFPLQKVPMPLDDQIWAPVPKPAHSRAILRLQERDLFICFLYLKKNILLFIPGWTGTHNNCTASASWVLWLRVHTHHTTARPLFVMVGVLFLKIVWRKTPSQVDSCKGTTTLASWQCWVAWWREPPVQTGNSIITQRLCHSSCCRTLRPLFCYWNDCVVFCTQQNSANFELVWGAEVPEPPGSLHRSVVVPCAHAWKLCVF